MSNTLAVSLIAPSTSRPGPWAVARVALAAVGSVALLTATARTVEAQTMPAQTTAEAQATAKPTSPWAFLVSTGTVVPTGGQRDAIKRANLTAAQVSYVVRPALAVSATVGWARSRDVGSDGDAKLDIFTYDFGAEVRARQLMTGRRINVRPFAGAGAGVRSYNYRDLPLDATHDVAAYVSAGGEVGIGRIHLRLEVRDYVTGFTSLGSGRQADARNDVVVMTGLRFATR
jgi:hypothetical protein